MGLQQKRIRTIVVDDSPLALQTICSLVAREQNMEVIATAADGCAAVALARSLCPDLVLLDLEMPLMGGIETTSCLAQQCPNARVVIVTVHDTPALRRACEERGACAFVAKTTLHDDLPGVVRRLFGNGKYE